MIGAQEKQKQSARAQRSQYRDTRPTKTLELEQDAMQRLARAIWAAGFRAGHANGSDAATAYESGSRSRKPQDPDEAWAEDVQWRIDAESFCKLDIEKPEAWIDVP